MPENIRTLVHGVSQTLHPLAHQNPKDKAISDALHQLYLFGMNGGRNKSLCSALYHALNRLPRPTRQVESVRGLITQLEGM